MFEYKLSAKEQTLFAKRLSYLVRAGVPILESLELLTSQMRSKSGKKMFTSICSDVANGQYLSSAMAKFKSSFSEFIINIIRVGEHNGILAENLEYLAEELKKKQALQRKILGAMFYPLFIVLATIGLTGVLTVFVFPKVLPIFSSVSVDLPITTKILMFVSRFLISYGWLVLILLAVSFFVLTYLTRVPKFKIILENIIFRMPLFAHMAKSYHLANITRTLGLLLKGDSRLESAILTTSTTTSSLVYRQALSDLSLAASRGERMSYFMLKAPHLFPDMVSHMVAVGENTGNLSETFLYLSEMYEQDLDEITKNLSGLLEPVLMVFMGLLVGFVAISIITPIYSVTQKLRP